MRSIEYYCALVFDPEAYQLVEFKMLFETWEFGFSFQMLERYTRTERNHLKVRNIIASHTIGAVSTSCVTGWTLFDLLHQSHDGSHICM